MANDYPKFIPRKVRELALEKRLGVFLLNNSSEFEWWCEEYIFEEGVIRGRPFFLFFSVKSPYLWKEVSMFNALAKTFTLNRYEVSTRGCVETQYVCSMKIQLHDGRIWKINFYGNRVRTAATYYSMYGVRDHQPNRSVLAATQIREKIAAAQVEQLRPRLEAGGTAEFGSVSATIEGIIWHKRRFFWEQAEQLFVPWQQVTAKELFEIPVKEGYNISARVLLRDIMNSDTPLVRKNTTD